MFRFTTSVVLFSGIGEPKRGANTKPVAENLPLEDCKIVRSTEISPHKHTDLRARKNKLCICLRVCEHFLERCGSRGVDQPGFRTQYDC